MGGSAKPNFTGSNPVHYSMNGEVYNIQCTSLSDGPQVTLNIHLGILV